MYIREQINVGAKSKKKVFREKEARILSAYKELIHENFSDLIGQGAKNKDLRLATFAAYRTLVELNDGASVKDIAECILTWIFNIHDKEDLTEDDLELFMSELLHGLKHIVATSCIDKMPEADGVH